VEILSVNSPRDTKNLLSVEMRGVGSFEHVVRLVDLIQNSPYQIKIGHTYINKVAESPSSSVVVNGKSVAGSNTSGSLFEVNIAFDVVSTE
jgi:hypothetical protein